MEPRSRFRILAPDLEEEVACAAAADCPVLIFGAPEIGEWVARLIHARSERRASPFVPFYVTGEDDEDVARLEWLLDSSQHSRGTLFVSDISRSGARVQARLTDYLTREGPTALRFRVIAASALWIYALVNGGRFNDRLFYTLNRIHVCAKSRPRSGADSSPGPHFLAPCEWACAHTARC